MHLYRGLYGNIYWALQLLPYKNVKGAKCENNHPWYNILYFEGLPNIMPYPYSKYVLPRTLGILGLVAKTAMATVYVHTHARTHAHTHTVRENVEGPLLARHLQGFFHYISRKRSILR